METDFYFTINEPSEALFKDRGSKFLAFAFPVHSEEQVKEIQKDLRKKFYDARHHVYAFRLDPESDIYRANDDGEPANSSGPPVLGQIKSFELFEVLIVVVRYFGGTKLGVPGLINAYKTAAQLAIENAEIIQKTISLSISIRFPYGLMNEVMKVTNNEHVEVLERNFTDICQMKFAVPKSLYPNYMEMLEKMYKLEIE
jgi:uncharacterized YigZ family protein